ncbi:uncharacterized protein CBL_11591 [Carabus blaptoides fortunei]
MIFLSIPYKLDASVNSDSVIWTSFINTVLLSAFILQHSIMIQPYFKQFIHNIGLDVLSRCIYNLTTSVTLLVLITYWSISSEIILWNIDSSNTGVWLIFGAIHLFAWSIIYTGCLFMDISEILGIKQVYYDLRNMAEPMSFKSSELQRLYGHTRHPSFSAFLVIFWAFPVMSLDRFLLALVLTGYMYVTWKTDKHDLHYQRMQYHKKLQELLNMH